MSFLALAILALVFLFDCGVFYRNASRGEFSLFNTTVMFATLVGIFYFGAQL